MLSDGVRALMGIRDLATDAAGRAVGLSLPELAFVQLVNALAWSQDPECAECARVKGTRRSPSARGLCCRF